MFEIYNNRNIELYLYNAYTKENYITFIVKLKLYNFCAEHSFCVAVNELRNFIRQLATLYENNSVEAKLCDYDSESFVSFKSNTDKTISLFGQLGSEWEDNLWRFRQNFDQTIVNLLIVNLSKLI